MKTQFKKLKNPRLSEELPSFLLNLNSSPEGVNFHSKPSISHLYLGPVFFGKTEKHPPLHTVKFSTFRHIKKTYHVKESIKDLFLPQTVVQKPVKLTKPFKLNPASRRKVVCPEPYTPKSRGTRKAFVPDVKPPVIDLGQSTSIIEGETVLEIPLYCLKEDKSGTSVPGFELVKFSDIKEKKRKSMPYKERISHIHYPKQFATVTVVGPTIPAAITITKIPSKRKAQSVTDFLNKPKDRKSSKADEGETSEIKEEPKVDFSTEQGDVASVEGSFGNERKLEIKIIDEEEEEEDGLLEVGSKEATEEVNDGETEEMVGEEVKEEETEVGEITEENEEEMEENPDEEPGN